MGSSPLSSNSSVWPLLQSAGSPEYRKGSIKLELDMTGYPVPNPSSLPPLLGVNILLESISLSSSVPEEKLLLQGAFIVRNLTYPKDVAVRFTVDDWSTVSEIKATWVANFPSPFISQRSSVNDTNSWDQFTFSINLSDYTLASLPSKIIYFIGRYTVPGAEFWDNCGGRNWLVKFKFVKGDQDAQQLADIPAVPTLKPVSPPNVVVSSPTVSPPAISKPEVTETLHNDFKSPCISLLDDSPLMVHCSALVLCRYSLIFNSCAMQDVSQRSPSLLIIISVHSHS
ncbi:putative phosphatase regulatory subunit-domain-containing protein [Lentinula raphanica]|uniref:Phosphatase regulatory subunit-domain-containing protein n=1 Tax=Lentinula raphanica TaxID=153919 RepID=A0AA38PLE8_9AGAR|nr:putative phosphatase regulatory subunit-domain-containing protein [Lentinula raphanica]